MVTALAAIFIASVLANPLLPRFNLRPLASLPHAADVKPKPLITANPSEQKAKRAAAALQRELARTKHVLPAKRPSQTAPVPPPNVPLAPTSTAKPLSIGFYINWDESSYA